MKIFKKALMLTLAISMVGCMSVGCSETEISHNGIVVTTSLAGKAPLVGNIPCEFPLVSEDTSLNVLVTANSAVDQHDVYVWKKYEEMTGVTINWNTVTKDKRDEAVYNSLINKNNLDLIIRCKVPSGKLTQYGEGGMILNLAKDDMLKKYAPNCWAYLQAHPDTRASVTNPDGAIYSLPQVNSGAELRVARKLFFNKKWLERVGLDIPKTTDELYDVLKAFKNMDANGNGDKNDEIPFCAIDWVSVQDGFFGAFGLGNRGVHNQIVDCDESTGKARFIAASNGYKKFLKYIHKLYSEKLLDNHVFTITTEQWKNNAEKDRIGVFANTNLAWIPADQVDDWVALDEALEGPDGYKLWAPIRANIHSSGAAVIPSTCKNPELVLKWLDYFWTDEGTLFYHMGIEGETFESKDDGTYDYSSSIYDQMTSQNKSFDDIVANYSPYPGGSNPTVEIVPYFMGGEIAKVPAEAARKLFEYGPSEYWPIFTFTDKENETLETIQTDILKYTDSMRIGFITGSASFSNWDKYIAQLNSLKMDKLLSIYQFAIDRYSEMETK